MRNITIKREESKLFTMWIDYWCVFDFDANKIPLYCTKGKYCIDCEDYCEKISSSRQRELFIEASYENGNKEFIEKTHAVPIQNGKTLKLELDDNEHELLVFFLPPSVASNRITIPAGCSDLSFSIKTTGGILDKLEITIS